MDITKTIYKIQYQVAKIEVVELLFLRGKNTEPSLDTEMAYNMILTIRRNLWEASEACLLESTGNSEKTLSTLKQTLTSASNFLIQSCSGLSSQEPQVLFLAELLTNINSELIKLTGELDKFKYARVKKSIQNSDLEKELELLELSISPKSRDGKGEDDQSFDFRTLVNMCSGERETAERLIEHELKKLPGSNRYFAILCAIEHLKDDNR